jgi:hypothetical protein
MADNRSPMRMPEWITKRFQEYDFFPDFIAAVIRQWQSLIWGETVIAAIFVAVYALSSPPKWVLGIWLVIAMLIACYFAWRVDHVRLMRKFDVNELQIKHAVSADRSRSIWIQIIVNCLTDAPIENCHGHLLRVLHKFPADSGLDDSQWAETEMNESLKLNWSLTDVSSRLIPGVPARLNVFSIHEFHIGFFQPDVMPKPLYMFQAMSQQGRYRFELRISGTDCEPIDVAVEAERGDVWDKPIVKLIMRGEDEVK